ncbi:MAG: hypothetical protein ACREBW_09655 [Candidatus Micrarchaeaceae archaeon]
MSRDLRMAAIGGVCALLLLVPVIILGRVISPAALLQQTGRQTSLAVLLLNLLFGVAYIVFIYGFVCVGERHGSRIVSLSGYLLMLSYFVTVLFAAIASYFSLAQWLAPISDIPLIFARGVTALLLGVAILISNPKKESLTFWSGVFALMSGIGTLFQLVGAGWDDLANIPLLITGLIMFFSASD